MEPLLIRGLPDLNGRCVFHHKHMKFAGILLDKSRFGLMIVPHHYKRFGKKDEGV